MNLDLNSLLQESLSTAGQLADTVGQINVLAKESQDVVSQKVKLANDAAEAAKVKVQSETTEIARQESTRQAIAARLGTDSSKPGWIIGKAADTIAQADKELEAADQEIFEKQSVTFLSNPIGWIGAQMTMNDSIAKYNFAARKKNRAEETAASAEKMTQTAFQTNNALSATMTDAYVNAMQVLGAHQYATQAVEAAGQGLRWNMEGIVAASNMSRDRLQVLYSANNAAMQEKHYQTELQRLRLSTASYNLQKAASDEKLSEDSLIGKYIADGYFVFTGKQMDPMKAKEAMILFKSKQPDIMAMFESGLASSKVTGGDGIKPVISLSPAKAVDLVNTGKVVNISPAMKEVTDQLSTWQRQFNNPAVQSKYPYDPKDKAGRETAFNAFVEDQRKQTMASVPNGSIFAPVSIDKIAKVNKQWANSPLWKNVLEPASKTGIDMGDPNIVFGVVMSAMQENKISYIDALDLAPMYANGMEMNNQNRNFLAFGMGTSKTYNASVKIPGTIGSTTVNMTDQKTLATALNKAAANTAFQKRGMGRQDSFAPLN